MKGSEGAWGKEEEEEEEEVVTEAARAVVTEDEDKAVWLCHRQPCYPTLQRSGALNILSVDTSDTSKDRVPGTELSQPGT